MGKPDPFEACLDKLKRHETDNGYRFSLDKFELADEFYSTRPI